MQAPTFRARSIPELLDAAFQMLRARYLQLVTAALVISLPAFALGVVLLPDAARLRAIVHSFVLMYAGGAAVVIVSDAYLGRERSLGAVLRAVFSRFRSIWRVGIMKNVMIFIGLIMLVVPGVIVFIMSFAMVPVVLIEGASTNDAFERSRDLARGHWGRILSVQLLGFLLMYLAYFGLLMAIGVLSRLAGGINEAAAELLAQVFLTALYPLPATVTVLLYYDIRIRKEAFDIQMLVDAVPAIEPVPAAPVPA